MLISNTVMILNLPTLLQAWAKPGLAGPIIWESHATQKLPVCIYHYFPKFSDGQAWANSADPDQTRSSLIRVYTVCHSACTIWMHYSMVKLSSSNFRMITAIFRCLNCFWYLWYTQIPKKLRRNCRIWILFDASSPAIFDTTEILWFHLFFNPIILPGHTILLINFSIICSSNPIMDKNDELSNQISHIMRNPVLCYMRTTKTQIRLLLAALIVHYLYLLSKFSRL